ncbi:MAG: metallophosphoesterase [Clostridia bacterium]|nr:metallophosphoesterase [Clostridia bacterium]
MRYALSDPHGEYDLFRKLLNEIDFGETDEMIVLGDVIDKGRESVRLLRYVLSQPNITLLIGNHEYDFLKYYHGVMSRLEDGFDADDALRSARSALISARRGRLSNGKTSIDWKTALFGWKGRTTSVCTRGSS